MRFSLGVIRQVISLASQSCITSGYSYLLSELERSSIEKPYAPFPFSEKGFSEMADHPSMEADILDSLHGVLDSDS